MIAVIPVMVMFFTNSDVIINKRTNKQTNKQTQKRSINSVSETIR